MVKRQKHRSDELMLIPFLDILCSLIGVLVLIIVVLVVAQTQRINGRTPEELRRAEDYLRMLKLKKVFAAKYAGINDKLEQLKQLQDKTQQTGQQAAKLKDLISNSEVNRAKNMEAAAKLEAELEKLVVELRGLTSQEPALKTRVAALTTEIEKVKPPVKKDATVQVNPQGSGVAIGQSVFFIDAGEGKLTCFWNEKERSMVSATPDTIVQDEGFNAFLEAVRKVPQSKIIFLIRDDGMNAYRLGAGWAQEHYGYGVEKIAKLPVPGHGEMDLSLFGKALGSLPMPAIAAPPPPPAPAPAPGMAPGAAPAPAQNAPKPTPPQNPPAPAAPAPPK
jgi:hypothetical protein